MVNLISMRWITLSFLLFIGWIIYAADTGVANVFFDLVDVLPYGDKLGHFFLFGILAMLLNLTLRFKYWKQIPIGSVLVFVFVLIEELSQFFFPNRTLDIVDIIADVLGIIVFTIIGQLLFKSKFLVLDIKN